MVQEKLRLQNISIGASLELDPSILTEIDSKMIESNVDDVSMRKNSTDTQDVE